MSTLKKIDGRLWREPTMEVWCDTLDGKRLKTFVCRSCKEQAYLSEAYVSKTLKTGYRPYHASCWNKYNGKSFTRLVPKVTDPVATLDFYI